MDISVELALWKVVISKRICLKFLQKNNKVVIKNQNINLFENKKIQKEKKRKEKNVK
jgi:hypothetical protein